MYDGNAAAVINNLGDLDGVLAQDIANVSVDAMATYNDAAISSDKTITVDYSLAGLAKDNYTAPESDLLSDAKILDEVKITEDALTVPAIGGCQDEALYIAYNIVAGEPVEYKIVFNAYAKTAGFTDVAYTNLPSIAGKDSIFITVPAGTLEGLYEAEVIFRNEIGIESTSFTFAYTN